MTMGAGRPVLGCRCIGNLFDPNDKGNPRSHGQATWFNLPWPLASGFTGKLNITFATAQGFFYSLTEGSETVSVGFIKLQDDGFRADFAQADEPGHETWKRGPHTFESHPVVRRRGIFLRTQSRGAWR
jgi:hypothetical protein